MKLFTALLALTSLCTTIAQLVDDVEFQWSSAKMPFPVSDVMANYMEGPNGDEDGFVIITGGCDAVNGNERANFGEDDLFSCFSSGNKTLKFDPFTESFETMTDMLHERQRHGGAVIDGELYVIGGRDSNDDLVAAIDSFDPETNAWTTRGEVPSNLLTSDLTAWAWKDYLYVAGGFLADYTAVGVTYRIKLSRDTTDLQFETLATSPHPRGDYHAVTLFGYAYLAGGITHTSLWCEALTTAERYHMESDTWEQIQDLEVGRADMAVATLNGKILAMGGEEKPDDCAELSDPAYGSFPSDAVSVLLSPEAGKDAEWVNFRDFKDERFRFAAATVPAQNRVYTFGGQLPFDFTCDCFPTSDAIAFGVETFKADIGDDKLSGGAIAGIVVGSLIGAGLIVFILMKLDSAGKEKKSLKTQLELEQAAKENKAATDV